MQMQRLCENDLFLIHHNLSDPDEQKEKGGGFNQTDFWCIYFPAPRQRHVAKGLALMSKTGKYCNCETEQVQTIPDSMFMPSLSTLGDYGILEIPDLFLESIYRSLMDTNHMITLCIRYLFYNYAYSLLNLHRSQMVYYVNTPIFLDFYRSCMCEHRPLNFYQ